MSLSTLKLWMIAGLVVIVVGLIALAWPHNSSWLGKPTTSVDLSHAAVIQQMRGLQRLETASFTIEKIIEAGTDGNVFQEILYGDRILLIAHGRVIAGFDLSKLKDEDVVVRGAQLQLHLPAPEILVTALDNQQTQVYDRRLGVLSKGDKDLESQAREQAELAIRHAACDGLILEQASEQAEKQLRQLFTAVGFTDVEITIPAGNCS